MAVEDERVVEPEAKQFVEDGSGGAIGDGLGGQVHGAGDVGLFVFVASACVEKDGFAFVEEVVCLFEVEQMAGGCGDRLGIGDRRIRVFGVVFGIRRFVRSHWLGWCCEVGAQLHGLEQ